MIRHFIVYLSLFFTFILGIHDDHVALWTDSAPEPAVVFPCPARLLPEQDQQALQEGISVESAQELHRLLEDFLS